MQLRILHNSDHPRLSNGLVEALQINTSIAYCLAEAGYTIVYGFVVTIYVIYCLPTHT
jgi:hypothetical protein